MNSREKMGNAPENVMLVNGDIIAIPKEDVVTVTPAGIHILRDRTHSDNFIQFIPWTAVLMFEYPEPEPMDMDDIPLADDIEMGAS